MEKEKNIAENSLQTGHQQTAFVQLRKWSVRAQEVGKTLISEEDPNEKHTGVSFIVYFFLRLSLKW